MNCVFANECHVRDGFVIIVIFEEEEQDLYLHLSRERRALDQSKKLSWIIVSLEAYGSIYKEESRNRSKEGREGRRYYEVGCCPDRKNFLSVVSLCE